MPVPATNRPLTPDFRSTVARYSVPPRRPTPIAHAAERLASRQLTASAPITPPLAASSTCTTILPAGTSTLRSVTATKLSVPVPPRAAPRTGWQYDRDGRGHASSQLTEHRPGPRSRIAPSYGRVRAATSILRRKSNAAASSSGRSHGKVLDPLRTGRPPARPPSSVWRSRRSAALVRRRLRRSEPGASEPAAPSASAETCSATATGMSNSACHSPPLRGGKRASRRVTPPRGDDDVISRRARAELSRRLQANGPGANRPQPCPQLGDLTSTNLL